MSRRWLLRRRPVTEVVIQRDNFHSTPSLTFGKRKGKKNLLFLSRHCPFGRNNLRPERTAESGPPCKNSERPAPQGVLFSHGSRPGRSPRATVTREGT